MNDIYLSTYHKWNEITRMRYTCRYFDDTINWVSQIYDIDFIFAEIGLHTKVYIDKIGILTFLTTLMLQS
jgi:hypothetical protein